MMSNSKGYIPELESIRGLAAFTVLMEHWISFGSFHSAGFSVLLSCIHEASSLAVLVFFVLSGFVLSYVLDNENQNINAPTLAVRFWIRRIFRIYPLALAVVLTAFAFFGSIDRWYIDLSRWAKYNDFSWNSLTYSLLLLSSDLNTPGWTLKYELTGYMLMPLAFLSVSRRGLARVIPMTLGVIGFGALALFWSGWWMLASNFAWGFVAYLIWSGRIRVRKGPLVPALLVVGLITAIVEIGSTHQYERAVTTGLGIAAALLLILWAPPRYSEFLRLRPLRWLGRVSYSVYLLHYPIMWITGAALTRGRVNTDNVWWWLVIGLTGVVGTLILSDFTFRWIEKPCHRLGISLASRVRLMIATGIDGPKETPLI